MSKSIWAKGAAILLCVAALLTAAVSGLGIGIVESSGLYNKTPQEQKELYLSNQAVQIAEYLAYDYNMEHLTQFPEELQEDADFSDLLMSALSGVNGYAVTEQIRDGGAYYQLYSAEGKLLESVLPEDTAKVADQFTVSVNSQYPVVRVSVTDGQEEATTFPSVLLDPFDPTQGFGIEDGDGYWLEYESASGRCYRLYVRQGPEYELNVLFTQGAWVYDDLPGDMNLGKVLYPYRYTFVWTLLAGVAALLAGLAYLGWACGRNRRNEEVRAAGPNNLPLDGYLTVAVFGVVLLASALLDLRFGFDGASGFLPVALALLAGGGVLVSLLCVGFYCALTAQIKMGHGYWWRHSILGWCLRKIGHGIRWCWRAVRRLFAMLPLIWQVVVVGGCLGLLLIIGAMVCYYDDSSGFFVMALLLFALLVCYTGYAWGVLYDGVKRMAQGDLGKKVPGKYLIGPFRSFANGLNALADVAVVAARNQLRSERMKTELITNVSHDIKTPLTSIINYVDLLCKPHTEEEGEEYLEVLARQSQRMKKLLEDLLEMSKAASGNIHPEIREMDAAEAVNQALGEFADKLEAAGLTPVFPQPEEPVRMLADGRLVWRVLSNLLSNAVKYGLPGTRLYVDVGKTYGNVVISLKNISRNQLNITADELMERFVRGDASRNTEGSGLGLNIAQSLMELQRGQMQLLVDGDLFKVTLIFPGV